MKMAQKFKGLTRGCLREGILLLVFIKLDTSLRFIKFSLSTKMIEMLTKAIFKKSES